MVYAAIKSGLILTGGDLLADTWLLPSQSSNWLQLNPSTAAPARTEAAISYDSRRARVVLFGGGDSSGKAVGDVWEFDGTAWGQRTVPARPPTLPGFNMVYDEARGRGVLFGGTITADTPSSDTWELDASGWSLRHPAASPPGRSDFTAVYDSDRRRTVIVGGSDEVNVLSDTWTYDGTTWRSIASPAQLQREAASAAYDTVRHRAVLFGGLFFSTYLADTWALDSTGWHSITGAGPPARASAAMAYDMARGKLVLFGGFGDGAAVTWLQDTWELDSTSDTWTQIHTAHAPPARSSAAMAYDIARGTTVMFGGQGPGVIGFADTWEYDGTDWRERMTPRLPPGRSDNALVYDSTHRRTVLVGGGTFDDVWALTFVDGSNPPDQCIAGSDSDGDGLVACGDAMHGADPDCAGLCTPSCPASNLASVLAACDMTAPRCGDGICNANGETYLLCPQDCPLPSP
jgi:hypothetical protein